MINPLRCGIIACLLLLSTGQNGSTQEISQSPFVPVPTGGSTIVTFPNPIQEFQSKDLNGRIWRREDLKGKFTLINVWSTYCGPCRQEHPEIQRFFDKAQDNIQVLTFSLDDDPLRVSAYMSNHHYTFPVIVDPLLVKRLFSLEYGIPISWIINPAVHRSNRIGGLGHTAYELERLAIKEH